MVTGKGPIGALNALCPIIRNEFIVPDKPDFNDVCTKGMENKHYLIFLKTF